jgi:5S rRNA maturation endonuclease (ribonuclease M5)
MRSIKTDEGKIVLIICLITALIAFGTKAVAQKVEKTIPKQEKVLALGEEEVKQLLLLIDMDKSGKISKKEFMDFMEAEFERLDKDKSGELDVKELRLSKVRASQPAVGK